MVKETMRDDIVKAIKKKPELRGLDDALIIERVDDLLGREKAIREKLETAHNFKEFSRSGEFKELKSHVRKGLREIYGVFSLDEKKERKQLLAELGKKPTDDAALMRLLAIHQSSKERIYHYPEIYERIFAITGKPKKLLDLGCGANPYAYRFLGCAPYYIAIDLPSDDMHDIAEFFRIERIAGEVHGLDLVKEYEKISAYTADVVLLFKALDSLESVKRHVSGKLLDAIKAEWIVVSFPTMSLGGGKYIKKERRAWFEKLLNRKGWIAQTFEVENEMFYIFQKK